MPGPFGTVTRGAPGYDSDSPFAPAHLFEQNLEWIRDEERVQLGLLNRRISRPWTSVEREADGSVTVLHGHCFDPRSGTLVDAATLAALDRGNDPVDWAHFEGAFLFVRLDTRRGTLSLVNDRFAILPTYWAAEPGRFCFAPRLRYLPRDVYHREADPTSLIHFLAIGKYPGTRTPLTDVSLLGPATRLDLDLASMEVTSEPYWNLEYATEPGTSVRELVADLGDSIDRSVELMTDPRSGTGGIFLSGGWDSRAILGSAMTQGRPPARVITNGLDDDIEGTDTWLARRMAADLGLPYYFARREPEAGRERWLEGLWFSEIATENSPGNFGIHRLAEDEFPGLDYVLKGDVTWGSGDLTTAEAGVIDRNFPWPLGDNVLSVLSPGLKRDGRDLYGTAITDELARCPNDHPADRQQWLWQMSGINRYIFGLGYFDEEYIQVRRPLVTRLVLDQWRRVPWRLRIQKNLFLETIYRRYPSFFAYGRNHVSHLADYYALMAPFVRERALARLGEGADLGGLLDREECMKRLEQFTPRKSPRYLPGLKARVRNRIHDRHAWRWHRTRFYGDNQDKRLGTSDMSLAFRLYLVLEWFHGQRR